MACARVQKFARRLPRSNHLTCSLFSLHADDDDEDDDDNEGPNQGPPPSRVVPEEDDDGFAFNGNAKLRNSKRMAGSAGLRTIEFALSGQGSGEGDTPRSTEGGAATVAEDEGGQGDPKRAKLCKEKSDHAGEDEDDATGQSGAA